MTAVTSKMNRMVLLYMLTLSMVSLPTSLPKHLLVETADNQGGDDYGHCSCFLCCWDYSKGQQNEGKLFIIPWSFIPIFRHSRQSRHFMTLQYGPQVLQHNKESIVYATNWKQKHKGTKPLIHEKYSNDNYAITLTKLATLTSNVHCPYKYWDKRQKP